MTRARSMFHVAFVSVLATAGAYACPSYNDGTISDPLDAAPAGVSDTGAGSPDGGTGAGLDGGATGDGATEATVPSIVFGTCETPGPCNRSPEGSWRIENACIVDLLIEARMICPGLVASNQRGTSRGTITFTGAGVTRNLVHEIDLDLFAPNSCTLGACAVFADAIPGSFPGATGTCAPAGGGACNCAVHVTRNEQLLSTTFTLDAGRVTPASGQRFDVCVRGDGGARRLHAWTPAQGTTPQSAVRYEPQ